VARRGAPGLLGPDEYDVAGSTTGVVEAAEVLGPDRVVAGDLLIAMGSSGLHSNGYSLVRHVLLERAGWSLDRHVDVLGRTLGEELLEPTRLYTLPCLQLGSATDTHADGARHRSGLAHNLARVLPAAVTAVVDRSDLGSAAVFGLVGEVGEVPLADLEATLNMVVGMVAVTPADEAEVALALLGQAGIDAWVCGEVTDAPRGNVPRSRARTPAESTAAVYPNVNVSKHHREAGVCRGSGAGIVCAHEQMMKARAS
jgi:phosphoribosylformylglycinamidine cyclo-ligase